MWLDSVMAACPAYLYSDLVSPANPDLLLFERQIQICYCLFSPLDAVST